MNLFKKKLKIDQITFKNCIKISEINKGYFYNIWIGKVF